MRRVEFSNRAPKRIRELVAAGGGMKHRLMHARLTRRDEPPEQRFGREIPKPPEPETRLCPTCSMHVTAQEGAWCLLCPPFPIAELPLTTTGKPHWWQDAG
jgi:hypothetical protein